MGARLLRLILLVAAIFAAGRILPAVVNPYLLQIITLCGISIILAVSLNLINGFTGQFSLGHAGFMAVGAYTTSLITVWFFTKGSVFGPNLLPPADTNSPHGRVRLSALRAGIR